MLFAYLVIVQRDRKKDHASNRGRSKGPTKTANSVDRNHAVAGGVNLRNRIHGLKLALSEAAP